MDDIGIDRKLVILGCTDVGKTSITMRYCHNSFTTPTSATIGASFLQKRLVLDGMKMTLQIWDTAGQERFRSMAPMYYRNAKAAILVFDVTKENSFEKIKEWLEVLAVVGNKSDVPATFDLSRAKAFSSEIGAQLYMTSAKTGEGVEELFNGVTGSLLGKYREEENVRNKYMHDEGNEDAFSLDEKFNTSGHDKKCCG